MSGHFGPGQTGDETPSGDWELAVTDWTALSVDALCAGLSANRSTATIPSSASTLLRELLASCILRLPVFRRLFRQWPGFTAGPPVGFPGGWIFGSGDGGSIFTLIAGFDLSGHFGPGQTGDETPSGDWELAVTDWTALSVDAALCAGLSANRSTATIPNSASTLLRELLAACILHFPVFRRPRNLTQGGARVAMSPVPHTRRCPLIVLDLGRVSFLTFQYQAIS
jgi:hypothetical protein